MRSLTGKEKKTLVRRASGGEGWEPKRVAHSQFYYCHRAPFDDGRVRGGKPGD